MLAKRYEVSASTVRTWKSRDFVEDVSHTGHRLQTTLISVKEVVVRKLVLLSLDDLLVVTREFINLMFPAPGWTVV